MNPRVVYLIVLTGLVALVCAGAARAARMQINANLNAGQQVPHQTFKAPNGAGHFSGSLPRTGGKLSWHLTYRDLSSPVIQAYILVPKSRALPQVVVQLCAKCKASASGVISIPARSAKALVGRKSYVEIRTKKNKSGEIRGLITTSG